MILLSESKSANKLVVTQNPELNANLTIVSQFVVQNQKLENNPAAVYLSSLSINGRITMKSSLDKVAQLFTDDENATALTFSSFISLVEQRAGFRTSNLNPFL